MALGRIKGRERCGERRSWLLTQRERYCGRVILCVCVRERQRERVCVCVAVSAEQLHARAADICHATQGFPGCIPWGVMNVFLMDYLISNRGASKEAAFLVSACFGLGATVGQILAGIIGPTVYKRDKRYLAYLMRCVAPRKAPCPSCADRLRPCTDAPRLWSETCDRRITDMRIHSTARSHALVRHSRTSRVPLSLSPVSCTLQPVSAC